MDDYEELRKTTCETMLTGSLLLADIVSNDETAPSWINSLAYLYGCIGAFIEEPVSDELLLKMCYVATKLIEEGIMSALSSEANLPNGYEEWLKEG